MFSEPYSTRITDNPPHRAILEDSEVRALDVASLASVQSFASEIAAEHGAVDLLINNAGAESLTVRQSTVDGFEFHLGTG